MDAPTRKKVGIITKYAVENFDTGDWLLLGQMTNRLASINDHPRLFRAMSFGDEDYSYCAADVINGIFESSDANVDDVVDHFDIDLWYRQKHPEKAESIFGGAKGKPATFWAPGLLRVFLSHLSTNRARVSILRNHLEGWGMSAFVAHQDIEPTREWQVEIEAALASMDVLVALIEPKFRDSAWTDQEVGFALGRGIDVIPIRIGQDPHGFIGKIQGIQAKGHVPADVAEEVVNVLLRKPRYRPNLLQGIAGALVEQSASDRIRRIRALALRLAKGEMKGLLERAGLSDSDRDHLSDLIQHSGAFQSPSGSERDTDDIPF